MFFVLDPWSSAPVAYFSIRPKSQIFNIRHDYARWIRNFMVMMNKPRNLDFETWPIIRPKSQHSNIRHDGILSIRNFMLMKNNHFWCPVTCKTQKKCAPYFRGNTQFSIYFNWKTFNITIKIYKQFQTYIYFFCFLLDSNQRQISDRWNTIMLYVGNLILWLSHGWKIVIGKWRIEAQNWVFRVFSSSTWNSWSIEYHNAHITFFNFSGPEATGHSGNQTLRLKSTF
jgi:hypothetical protein